MYTLFTHVTMPVVVHSNSGPSGPWTESDTKIAIAIWLAFTIIGLTGLLVEYIRYYHSITKDSFIDFVMGSDLLFGTLTIWPSLLVNAIYIICMLIYGIYSIL
jgi:hypothetical protein